jgi:hypothetical protein
VKEGRAVHVTDRRASVRPPVAATQYVNMTHGSKGKLGRYITDERYPQTAKANLTMANMLIASDNKRYGTLFLFQEGLFGIENHPAVENIRSPPKTA